MNIEHLRYFYDLSKEKSISSVAKKNHISQSALSQQLLKLEDNFETKLLFRSNKGVSLTKEGLILAKYCESILLNYDNLLLELSTSNSDKKLITVGGLPILTSSLITLSIPRLKCKFPKYTLKIISSNCQENNNSLEDVNTLTISYTKPQGYSNYHSRIIFNDRLIFITNNTYLNRQLTLEKFLSTPFILVNDGSNLNNFLDEALRRKGASVDELNYFFVTDSYQSALLSLKQTKAIVLIPYSVYMACYKNTGYTEVEVDDLNIELPLYLNFNDQVKLKEKSFIDYLSNSIKGFLK